MWDRIEKYIEIVNISPGTKFYRYVNVLPNQCKRGMTHNKGTSGRCNKNQDIYYCAKSIDALYMEMNNFDLKGSLIISEVKDSIYLGKVIDPSLHLLLRGRIEKEEALPVHENVLAPNQLDNRTNYFWTNFIVDQMLRILPDGIMYSSVNSLDSIIGNVQFQLSEDTGWSNIALTNDGYSKIKEIEITDITKYKKNM